MLNFNVIGQGREFFLVIFCVHNAAYPRTVLSLEQGLMSLFCLLLMAFDR